MAREPNAEHTLVVPPSVAEPTSFTYPKHAGIPPKPWTNAPHLARPVDAYNPSIHVAKTDPTGRMAPVCGFEPQGFEPKLILGMYPVW